MRRLPLPVLLLLAACGSEPTASAPETPSTQPPVAETALLPLRKPSPSPERVMAAQRPAKKPAADDAPAELHLPAFTFRTMDHKEAKVEVNGEPHSTTPCLWSISRKTEGDAKLVLGPDWPPPGGRFIASTVHPDDPESKAELYVIDNVEQLGKLGIERAGECVIAWRGQISKTPVQGALRVRVYNYHFSVFAPLDNPEGDNASKFLRTLWFERIDDR